MHVCRRSHGRDMHRSAATAPHDNGVDAARTRVIHGNAGDVVVTFINGQNGSYITTGPGPRRLRAAIIEAVVRLCWDRDADDPVNAITAFQAPTRSHGSRCRCI